MVQDLIEAWDSTLGSQEILQSATQEKKSPPPFQGAGVFQLAEWTGLEPATPGVTGRYSNQLNYHSELWWVLTGSNRRPSPCKGDALPAELSTQIGKMPALLGRAAR